jgi:D-ribose pyranose/furanose isomerase RbsD
MSFQLRSLLLPLVFACALTSCQNSLQPPPVQEEPGWTQVLESDLNLLGHRNWILVVDKAFPEQSSAGMKYIYVEEDLLPVLEQVLGAVNNSTHVRPVIYQDKELEFISEEQVPGIEAFRLAADSILGESHVNTLLHDEVFKMLDESSSLFRVLVIKTNGTMPYTSVFLQLDCAYWGAEDEQLLRENMAQP